MVLEKDVEMSSSIYQRWANHLAIAVLSAGSTT